MTKNNLPQFNRNTHGSLYDRGSADAYYHRGSNPHWYPAGSYKGERIVDLTQEEIEEYFVGYNQEQERKEW
jgi:hypothetical protein